MPVRTTLTLDDDVAARLGREARSTGRPLRAVVNEAIRAGLDARTERAQEPFVVTPFDMGLREGYSIDSISTLIELLEGPGHR